MSNTTIAQTLEMPKTVSGDVLLAAFEAVSDFRSQDDAGWGAVVDIMDGKTSTPARTCLRVTENFDDGKPTSVLEVYIQLDGAGCGGWPFMLVDSAGNPLGVKLEGAYSKGLRLVSNFGASDPRPFIAQELAKRIKFFANRIRDHLMRQV